MMKPSRAKAAYFSVYYTWQHNAASIIVFYLTRSWTRETQKYVKHYEDGEGLRDRMIMTVDFCFVMCFFFWIPTFRVIDSSPTLFTIAPPLLFTYYVYEHHQKTSWEFEWLNDDVYDKLSMHATHDMVT